MDGRITLCHNCNFVVFRSTTAVCYFANNYAEETLMLEHLAVKFELEKSVQEFKRIFELCQTDLRTKSKLARAKVKVNFKMIV